MSDTNGKVVDRCWRHLAQLPCPQCDPSLIEQRERAEAVEAKARRLESICERLEKAGISPDDLAELLWMRVAHKIEGDIVRLCEEHVRIAIIQRLEGISLVSTVMGLADRLNREKQ